MVLAGTRIYSDGVGINHDAKEKIQQIVKSVKAISPSSEISLRFVKNGPVYEGLLWGNANGSPIGVFKRGISMAQVLENLATRVRKECLRVCKTPQRPTTRQPDLAMAG